jgi:hypothetical protein
MTPSTPSEFEQLSVDLAEQVDRACVRFETAWRSGERPRPEEYLAGVPAAGRAVLLRELVLLDVSYRRRAGETCRLADYQERFPELDAAWLAGVAADPAGPAEGSVGGVETGPPLSPSQLGVQDTSDEYPAPAAPAAKESSEESWPAISGYDILGV